jgi:hypothetical protein
MIQEAFDIDIHHIPMRYELFLDHFYRLGGTPLRAKAVRRILKVGFKKWLDHDLARLLDHPVPHCWNPKWSLPSVRLRDIDPQHRLRSVAPRPEVLLKRLEKGFYALLFDVVYPDTVHASPSPVRSDFSPGPPQYVRPKDAVVERLEAALPAPLGRLVELALELS